MRIAGAGFSAIAMPDRSGQASASTGDARGGGEIVIATEASVCTPGSGRRPGTAARWGWVSSDGESATGILSGRRESVVVALTAIADACDAIPDTARARILSESREALTMIENSRAQRVPAAGPRVRSTTYLSVIDLLERILRRCSRVQQLSFDRLDPAVLSVRPGRQPRSSRSIMAFRNVPVGSTSPASDQKSAQRG